MTDLKLCPFCGDTYAVIYTTLEDGYCAECLECHAKTDWFSTKAEAITAWNRRADGWIPVTERLPEEHEVTLVRGDTSPLVFLCWYEKSEREWYDSYGNCIGSPDRHVTHWMPLPQPPEVK